eukprot:3394057-Pleurochrysis_carterae.AAC.1
MRGRACVWRDWRGVAPGAEIAIRVNRTRPVPAGRGVPATCAHCVTPSPSELPRAPARAAPAPSANRA